MFPSLADETNPCTENLSSLFRCVRLTRTFPEISTCYCYNKLLITLSLSCSLAKLIYHTLMTSDLPQTHATNWVYVSVIHTVDLFILFLRLMPEHGGKQRSLFLTWRPETTFCIWSLLRSRKLSMRSPSINPLHSCTTFLSVLNCRQV